MDNRNKSSPNSPPVSKRLAEDVIGGVGGRIYLVRLALGDGMRTPMPMRRFAAALTEGSQRAYEASMISLLETGKRRASLEDIDAIARIDPQFRGRAWLAFGDGEASAAALEEVMRDVGGDMPTGSLTDLSASEFSERAYTTLSVYLEGLAHLADLLGPDVRKRYDNQCEIILLTQAGLTEPAIAAGYREAIEAYVQRQLDHASTGELVAKFFADPPPLEEDVIPVESMRMATPFGPPTMLLHARRAADRLGVKISPNLGRRGYFDMSTDDFRAEAAAFVRAAYLLALAATQRELSAVAIDARLAAVTDFVKQQLDEFYTKLDISSYAADYVVRLLQHLRTATPEEGADLPRPPLAQRAPGPGSDDSLKIPPARRRPKKVGEVPAADPLKALPSRSAQLEPPPIAAPRGISGFEEAHVADENNSARDKQSRKPKRA